MAGAWTSSSSDPRRSSALLLDADDERTLEHVAAGGAVAITAANVLTLRSLQLKGRSLGLDAANPATRSGSTATSAPSTPTSRPPTACSWETFELFFPASYVACLVSVAETFDQTPGPGAGARTGSS